MLALSGAYRWAPVLPLNVKFYPLVSRCIQTVVSLPLLCLVKLRVMDFC